MASDGPVPLSDAPSITDTLGEQPVGRNLRLVLAGKQHGAAGVDKHHVWRDGLQPNRIAASQVGVAEDRVEDPLMEAAISCRPTTRSPGALS